MYFDTHSHLNFKDFDSDWEEVAQKCLDNNVWMINSSPNFVMSKKAIKIAENFEKGVYASVGLHPLNATVNLSDVPEDRIEKDFDINNYKKLALSSKKVVAIGECGLDAVSWEGKNGREAEAILEKQKQVLLEQVELAIELNLPLIFHCRKAHNELISILKSVKKDFKGVIHCFTGNNTQMKEYLDLGLYLGFNGIIFKMDIGEIIKKAPIDRVLIETDCPFLTPPKAEMKRNEPCFVNYIAERIAEIRGAEELEIAERTFQNAKDLFLK